jgi:hypothetical protein
MICTFGIIVAEFDFAAQNLSSLPYEFLVDDKALHFAYVGTTGSSTGNHLHFMVIKNGKNTDPMAYFE